jgi:tRNA-2-methylthio-N6-dimethylallyladenosine synthase
MSTSPASRPTPAPRPPTSSSSTPARSARTPTTSSTATSAPAPVKLDGPDLQIAVGGCMAQKDRETRCASAPWVDVVFGTHNIGSLPDAAGAGPDHNKRPGRDPRSALVRFPRRCPPAATAPYAGVGLDLGGLQQHVHVLHRPEPARQGDRTAGPGDILAEIRALVAEGVHRGHAARPERQHLRRGVRRPPAFGKLLRACGDIEGLERVRFTSPHPASFTDDVIEAMAETPNVMPSLHMPLQSGSDRMLRAMRRSYRSERFLGILDGCAPRCPTRRSRPTSSSVSPARPRRTSRPPSTSSRRPVLRAFTFQYSIRPGTPRPPCPTRSRRPSCRSATSA